MSMSDYEENILAFKHILNTEPELFSEEDRKDLKDLLSKLPDNVEEISNAIALWYEEHPLILDAILNIPIDDLDSLRAANGRAISLTGRESKEMIENSVTQSSQSKQPLSSSSKTKNE